MKVCFRVSLIKMPRAAAIKIVRMQLVKQSSEGAAWPLTETAKDLCK